MTPQQILWEIFKYWWWVPTPFVIGSLAGFFWLYWKRTEWARKQEFILLEIKIPENVLKPIKAMENVFSGFWQLYSPVGLKDKWFKGKFSVPFSLEIVGIGGKTHFFVRIPVNARNLIESVLYSQYPDAEIMESKDYTKNIPQNIPNDEWDVTGHDYAFVKDDVYPIKTYAKFFEEKAEISKEEKRIDPLSVLLEGVAKLKPDEQLWVQINAMPVTGKENDYIGRGKDIIDELSGRSVKPKPKPAIKEVTDLSIGVVKDAANVLISGKVADSPSGDKSEEFPRPPQLTQGERDVISAIEEKISKSSFNVGIRYVYLAKKDVFFGPNVTIPMSFFTQFNTNNLNAFKPYSGTATSFNTILLWFLDKRRSYSRKRKMFKRYVDREQISGATYIMNIEELASLFHFPSRMLAPSSAVSRVESKKGEAPLNLPIE